MLKEHAAKIGLVYGDAKRKLLQPPGNHGSRDASLVLDQFPVGITLVNTSLKIGDVQVGSDNAVREKSKLSARDYAAYVSRIAGLAKLKVASKMALLAYCCPLAGAVCISSKTSQHQRRRSMRSRILYLCRLR